MARPFTKDEAKQLIKQHQDLLNKANELSAVYSNLFSDVKIASTKIKEYQADEFLKTVPVEVLNSNESGIRVKLLEDNGIKVVSDLKNATADTLSKISGIGKESGQKIINVARNYEGIARQKMKVKLNADDKNQYSTALIKSVYRVLKLSGDTSKFSNAYSNEKNTINSAIDALNVVVNSLTWIFVSSEKKQKSISAFNYLKTLQSNGYVGIISGAYSNYSEINSTTDDEIWVDFQKNSINYINQIEKIVPDLLGTDDQLHGLPEELAKEIQSVIVYKEGLNCELRRYQEWGVKYGLHQGKFILGDEMGLGKTIQAIATMVSLRCTGQTHFVVVCPASVISNWCREISTKSKLSAVKIHGADKTINLEKWISEGGVAVTTYETTGIIKLEDNFKFAMLVVDEAHYIKNPNAQRSKNVREICKHAENIMFMTGTALENRVDEMIELIDILNPDLTAKLKATSFMSAAPEFRNMIAPVYYRRKREDVLTELPEKIETQEWCELNKEEEKVYEEAILAKKTAQARRVSWNAPDINESCKAKRLLEIVEEAEADGRKVIVFSFFLDTMKTVTQLLGDRCVSVINGSVPPQKRQEIIDEFEKAPAGAVLPAQIQAGGTGLNIQSASVVIICEPQYKPSIENQAISRAYRMGQARNVLVYRLLCEDTIDEKITKLLEDKQEIFDAFANDSEAAKENFEIDDKSLGDLIQEEIDRINAKRANEIN